MLEVEIRYRHPDWAAVISRLEKLGAVLSQTRTDIDQYLNAPDRDLKTTGEAFRIRSIGFKNFLTYKGPKREEETKTRREIEVPLGDGSDVAEQTLQLLLALGYRTVVVVRKRRLVYQFSRDGFALEACFDDVEKAGAFIELEILAEEEQFEAAKRSLLQTAFDVGLTEKETRSYLAMVLEAAKK